ncbi:hypothetical protein IWX47DRAFT_491510 [Phyllosticta citricarpa]
MGCLSLSAVIRHPSSGIGCHQPMRLKPPIRTQPHTLTRKLIPHLPLLACLLACLRGRCWGVEQFIQFLLLFETIGALSLCTPSARVSCALGRQADRHRKTDRPPDRRTANEWTKQIRTKQRKALRPVVRLSGLHHPSSNLLRSPQKHTDSPTDRLTDVAPHILLTC